VAFFEELGIDTHLADYGVSSSDIDAIVTQLEQHGMTALSETQDLSLDISREILSRALSSRVSLYEPSTSMVVTSS
jgi:NADP-dependent alcohol dehydrogenase